MEREIFIKALELSIMRKSIVVRQEFEIFAAQSKPVLDVSVGSDGCYAAYETRVAFDAWVNCYVLNGMNESAENLALYGMAALAVFAFFVGYFVGGAA